MSNLLKYLAGDDGIEILAFAIWRGCSQLLSHIQAASDNEEAEADTSGASHTKSRWQEEDVAFDDLPNRKRPDLQWGKSIA